ncbi:MAG: ATP-binding cassette domain-containing protein [Bacteroidota bacterium]
MISIQQLTKMYGQQKAVSDLNLEIPSGQILGFLGPNGAGKSTTMKILTGFLTPSSGSAEVDGYNVQTHPLEVRRRLGYLPEHNPLYLDMYVHEFLDMVGRIYQLDKATRKQRISQVIEQTGLGREQHKQIGMLSKGFRQRVGLAQALLHDPTVLILDEPTTGLDPNQIVEIRELIREVGQDKTVMFSSHILSEVEAIASRIVILNQGVMVADQPTAEIAKLAEDSLKIQLEVEKAGFDLAGIQALPAIKSVKPLSDTSFEITSHRGSDVRRALFEACVAQNNAILGLSQQELSLEDTFRALTQSAAS